MIIENNKMPITYDYINDFTSQANNFLNNNKNPTYFNISLLTCNFNNSYITMQMLRSFMRLNMKMDIYIMDNSTREEIHPCCKTLFNVIDNTNYKIINDYKQKSMNHCAAIAYAFQYVIKTDYVLLVDNDILFKDTVPTLFNDFEKYDVIGEAGRDFIIPDRLFPFFCIINLKKMKEDKKIYFDMARCMKEVGPYSSFIHLKEIDYTETLQNLYDTGASFYEDIRYDKNWNMKHIKLDDYIIHFFAGSDISRRNKDNNFIHYTYFNYNDFYNKNRNYI